MLREPWPVRLLALCLCALLIAVAVSGSGRAAFCAAWLVTATIPFALRSLAIVPAAVALVAGAIVLAPSRPAQGLLALAVAGFVVETVVVVTGGALLGRPAPGSVRTVWVAAAGWAAFAAALAALVAGAGGAILLTLAAAWCLAWFVPAARRLSVSAEAVVAVPARDMYRTLSDVSAWGGWRPQVVSCEALGERRWRLATRQTNGATTEQILDLVDAQDPSRLAFLARMGRQRTPVRYAMHDDAGGTRVLNTDVYVLPYVTALLGGRWAGYDNALRAHVEARLDGIRDGLESGRWRT